MALKLQDGTTVPSVTTIVRLLSKPALYVWHNQQGLKGINTTQVLNNEAKTGTLLHEMVEHYLTTGGEYLIETKTYDPGHIKRATQAYVNFKKWAQDHTFEDVKIEMPLVSETQRFGGVLDIYCKMDGKWTLIDLKTSGYVYKDQLLQVAAYKALLEENGYPVEQSFVVSVDKYTDYTTDTTKDCSTG